MIESKAMLDQLSSENAVNRGAKRRRPIAQDIPVLGTVDDAVSRRSSSMRKILIRDGCNWHLKRTGNGLQRVEIAIGM